MLASNKICLITGGGSGIGEVTAMRKARRSSSRTWTRYAGSESLKTLREDRLRFSFEPMYRTKEKFRDWLLRYATDSAGWTF